jgi:hypothetical protein
MMNVPFSLAFSLVDECPLFSCPPFSLVLFSCDLRSYSWAAPKLSPPAVFNTARRAMVQRAQPPAWKPGMTFSYLKNGKILFAKATSRASAVLDHLMAPDE